jgi:hypothetical protein
MDEIEVNDEAKVKLREKQDELIKVIEAFARLETSSEWAVLKELVFDRSLVSIERQILAEASSPQVDINKLYRLQGELAWARQYNNVGRFIETLRKQLENIKNKLK